MDTDKTDAEYIYYLHCLRQIKGLGPSKIKSLIRNLGNIKDIFEISFENLVKIPGINNKLATEILLHEDKFEESKNFIDGQIEIANKINGRLIPIFHDDYPKNLEQTGISPIIIYALGNFKLLKSENFSKAIAVVGTREPSDYAKNAAYNISQTLSNSGWVIVSGLARGIDGIVHEACLRANGKTVAVVGNGVDIINPKSNTAIYEEIITKGLIISEYPFGTKTSALNLKKRNKLTVGLSKFVVVIETGVKGGTMNAVKAAQEQKKRLFVLEPNYPIASNSEGNLLLINEGKAIKINQNNVIDIIQTMDTKNEQRTLF